MPQTPDVNPAFIKLMTIEPQFHRVSRKHTPMTYRGANIIAHVGSCQQAKCKWGSSYANREGLALGIWRHRQAHVIERRRELLWHAYRLHPHSLRTALFERDIKRASDRQTHTEDDWAIAVDFCMRERGAFDFKFDDHSASLLTFYAMGMLAAQAASMIYKNHYEPQINLPSQRSRQSV